MEWLNATLTAAGLALLFYGLFLAWPPLAFTVGGLVTLRVAWTFDRGDS
jgi:hypothetical protein